MIVSAIFLFCKITVAISQFHWISIAGTMWQMYGTRICVHWAREWRRRRRRRGTRTTPPQTLMSATAKHTIKIDWSILNSGLWFPILTLLLLINDPHIDYLFVCDMLNFYMLLLHLLTEIVFKLLFWRMF